MASTTKINLSAWCDGSPHQSAARALRDIDWRCELAGDHVVANAILRTEWTAIVVLLAGSGIPRADLLPHMARFCKLDAASLARVKDAIEMRQRALERIAA